MQYLGTRSNINVVEGNVENSIIGGSNNQIIVRHQSKDSEWEEIKKLFEMEFEKYNENQREYLLIKQAIEYCETRNKRKLNEHIKAYFEEFTKNILTGAAAQVVLKFLL